jgi:hypothetical protein
VTDLKNVWAILILDVPMSLNNVTQNLRNLLVGFLKTLMVAIPSKFYLVIFCSGNQPGREAEHSPPSSAEVNNSSIYISSPWKVFMAWWLINHEDNLSSSVLHK